MGMYHSTSGKLGFTPYAVRLPQNNHNIPVITRDQMRLIMINENRLRLSAPYQQAITDSGYVLQDLHRVTLNIQRTAIKQVLGTDVIARFQRAATEAAEAKGGPAYDKFRHGVMDNLLTQLHNARYQYRDDPEMNKLTVYQKFDRSRPGTLQRGDAAPDVDVVDLASGQRRALLSYLDAERPLVLVCGSVS